MSNQAATLCTDPDAAFQCALLIQDKFPHLTHFVGYPSGLVLGYVPDA